MTRRLLDRALAEEPDAALALVTDLLDASTEHAMVAQDLEGRILLWNEGARRLYGWSSEEVLGSARIELLHAPEDVAAGRPREMLEAALRYGRWEGHVQRVRKNGDRFFARVVITSRSDELGRVLGFLVISEDASRERPEEQSGEAADHGSLRSHLGHIRELGARFEQVIAELGVPAAEGQSLAAIRASHEASLRCIERATERLYELVRLELDLAAAREVPALCATFCRRSLRMLEADRVALAFLEEVGGPAVSYELARGGAQELGRRELVSGEEMVRLRELAERVGSAAFGDPQVRELAGSLLGQGAGDASHVIGARLQTQNRRLGLVVFGRSARRDPFAGDDQLIAAMLAAELALLVENLELCDVVQTHAVALQVEMARRREAELCAHRLNRMLATLSGINSAIVRVRDRDELFEEVCRVAVRDGGFVAAWISVFGATDTERFRVHSAWPAQAEHWRRLISADDRTGHHFLLELVLREHRPLWANLRSVPEGARQYESERRLRSGAHAAVPLVSGGQAVAALSLVAGEAGFFEDVGEKLLADLMGDLSLALDHLARRERLEFLALHDVLTSLPNRSSLLERIAHQIESVSDERPHVAVAIVDIERFSRINETLGRQGADVLLREVAARLSERAGERFSVARVGGDSFAVAAPRNWTPEALVQAHRRINEAVFGSPFQVGGEELRLTVRTGAACYPADGKEPEQLFANAEAALLQAKARGLRLVFYSPEMNELAAASLRLEAKLRRAIELNEFLLWYQPTVDVATRRIVGLEALLRWQSPDRGLLPPAQFLPVLEQSGLIVDAGAWVLQRALADAASWKARGLRVPRIAVNVSALELRQVGFLDQVLRIVETAGAEPGGLELEVTETAVMEDLQAAAAKLGALRAKGIWITMDDFGTGYSSLGPLSQLPVMSLKIDRSFIADMERPESLSIVKAIVSMGHSLGLQVVGEGVETEAQARHLAHLRCDLMQGYLISPPVPFDETTKLLEGPRAEGVATSA